MKRGFSFLTRLFCLALCLSLCACSPAPAKGAAAVHSVEMALDMTPLANSPAVSGLILPEASGETVFENESALIDASNTRDGYVMIRAKKAGEKRLKVIVTTPDGTAYTYDLPRGSYTVFPLSGGNGGYTAAVYENAYETKYALLLDAKLTVKLKDEFAPFLTPNQFVRYDENSKAVLLAKELTKDMSDPLKKIEAVFHYVINNISYDHALAKTVKSGYLPDLDALLVSKKGICFDYASLMAAMLRSQNIPAKLVVGYTGSIYHAWISAYTKESGWVEGVIFFDGAVWKLMDPTFLSSSADEDMLRYVENAANYSAKYLY